MLYRVVWPSPEGAPDFGSMRLVGDYEAKSEGSALRMARRENRECYGNSKAMRDYRRSMQIGTMARCAKVSLDLAYQEERAAKARTGGALAAH